MRGEEKDEHYSDIPQLLAWKINGWNDKKLAASDRGQTVFSKWEAEEERKIFEGKRRSILQ